MALRADAVKLEKLDEQTRFFARYGITSLEELDAHKAAVEKLHTALKDEQHITANSRKVLKRKGDEKGLEALDVIVSVILVMSLTLCSSFGQYDLELSENDLVNIALTQVGTESGEEYWSWYGFDHEVGWCACFVSRCANEAGMISAGTMPKFAWCTSGALWFQSRDLWLDGSAVPEPGMIIFSDWYDDTLDEEGEPIGQDGETKIDVRFEDETVWLTQAQLCELYQSSKANVSEHVKNIFEEGELEEKSVVRKIRTTQTEDKLI